MAGRKALAWAVHLYTALSAPLGVWAVFAIYDGDFRRAWMLITATLFIDSTDGTLARLAHVGKVLPGFDGRRLDDIVDYLCWVLVPVVLLVRAELLPAWAAAAPLLASGYGFAQEQAKTDEDEFLGFPSYWSILGFYLYELDLSRPFCTAIILILSVLVFVPLRYPYPSKMRPLPLRAITILLGVPWAIMGIALALLLPDRPRWLALLSLYYPAYYALLTVALWLRRWRGQGSGVRDPRLEVRG